MDNLVKASKVKPKTRQELAGEYGVDRKTFYRWIKMAQLPITSGLIYPSEIKLIYKAFGYPYKSKRHKYRQKKLSVTMPHNTTKDLEMNTKDEFSLYNFAPEF